jgi:hypothetical protein
MQMEQELDQEQERDLLRHLFFWIRQLIGDILLLTLLKAVA